VNSDRFRAIFADHTVKILPSGPEIDSYFIFKTGTTSYAINLVTHMGRLYMSCPDVGTFALQPYAPDPMIWLRRHVDDEEALLAAIPDNLRPVFLCVRPPEIDQLANLLEGSIDGADREEYQSFLDWLYEYREELSPIPFQVVDDRIAHSSFFGDGLVGPEDLETLLSYTDDAYLFVAALRRFVDVAEARFSDDDIPWTGWRHYPTESIELD